jgi:ABC-type transport system involved in cytochrome bd biosynthesis fused ATPase/permease subunit
MTEFDEKLPIGANQKARMSLARAVYANKDIILMDDFIPSNTDRLCKKIFKRVFCTLYEKKTRVLCTESLAWAHLADRVILMNEGRVEI